MTSSKDTASILKRILQTNGVDPLREPQRVRGLLTDNAPQQPSREREVLLRALHSPIFQRAWQERNRGTLGLLTGLAQWLAQEHGYAHDLCHWGVETWALALDLSPTPATRKEAPQHQATAAGAPVAGNAKTQPIRKKTNYTLKLPPPFVLEFFELQHTAPVFPVSVGMRIEAQQVLMAIGLCQIIAPWAGIVTEVGPHKVTVRTDAASSPAAVSLAAYKSVIEAYQEKLAREYALLNGQTITVVLDQYKEQHWFWLLFTMLGGSTIFAWYGVIARNHAWEPFFVAVLTTSVSWLLWQARKKVKQDSSHYTRGWAGPRWLVPWLYWGSAIVALVTCYMFLDQLELGKGPPRELGAAILGVPLLGLLAWARQMANKDVRIAERLKGLPEDSSSIMVDCVEVKPVDVHQEFERE